MKTKLREILWVMVTGRVQLGCCFHHSVGQCRSCGASDGAGKEGGRRSSCFCGAGGDDCGRSCRGGEDCQLGTYVSEKLTPACMRQIDVTRQRQLDVTTFT